MTEKTNWEGVDVLIPRRFHKARAAAQASLRSDLGALIEALPGTVAAPPLRLADANIDQCRDWIGMVIRGLPTRPPMAATDDV